MAAQEPFTVSLAPDPLECWGDESTANANDEPDAGEERPADCECSGHERETLPCWYCYAEGVDEPNPDAIVERFRAKLYCTERDEIL